MVFNFPYHRKIIKRVAMRSDAVLYETKMLSSKDAASRLLFFCSFFRPLQFTSTVSVAAWDAQNRLLGSFFEFCNSNRLAVSIQNSREGKVVKDSIWVQTFIFVNEFFEYIKYLTEWERLFCFFRRIGVLSPAIYVEWSRLAIMMLWGIADKIFDVVVTDVPALNGLWNNL